MRLPKWNFKFAIIFICFQILTIPTHGRSFNVVFPASVQVCPLQEKKPIESLKKETKVQKVCKTDKCKKIAEYILQNMNINVLPCHNFYQFACGNYHKWHPIPDYIDRINPFRERGDSILEALQDALQTKAYENDSPSIRKASQLFESCMNEEAMEELGNLPIPIELNQLGLPIEPPFSTSVKRSYNFSRLLAKMHRHSAFSKFLFDVTVISDQIDTNINRLAFECTPPIAKFDTLDKPNEEIIPNHLNMNKRLDYSPPNVKRKALIEYMTNVIHYLYKNMSSTYRGVARSVKKQVEEVADFLMAVEETKKMESVLPEQYFSLITYMTMPKFQEITDNIFKNGNEETKIDWLDYTEVLLEDVFVDARQRYENGEAVLVFNLEQWKSVVRLMSKISADVMVRAIWWMTVEPVTQYGTRALREIRKTFHQRIGKPKRYKRDQKCMSLVQSHFPYVLGYILLKQQENPEQLRQNVITMIENINNAFIDTITLNEWLDSPTKMAIINKLGYIRKAIGYQNWMLDSKNLEGCYHQYNVYSDSLYLSRKNIIQTVRESRLKYLSVTSDYSGGIVQYDITTANGVYYPYFNSMEIPLTLLGPPFHDLEFDALNYGALGVVLGHEMGHAFDNLGRNFNMNGNRVRWWKKKSIQKYKMFETCFINQYSKYLFPDFGKSVDGRLTLGENIADTFGFIQAFTAYHSYIDKPEKEGLVLPGLELYSHEKLFTLAFANLFCDNVKPSFREWQLSNDVHTPSPARVNGVLRNSLDFARIWNCSNNSYMNPKDKCILW